MKYRVLEHYLHNDGLPSTPRGTRGPMRAIAVHDTEGGAGLQGAWNTISWMVATASLRNASYHEFWAWEAGTKEFTAIVCIPPSHASHSVAPQPTSPTSGLPLYEPDASVREALGNGWWDPNGWIYAVSIAGTVGLVNAWARDPEFLAACRRRFSELRALLGVSWRLEHFRFNPRTRTDPGTVLVPALGGSRIPDEEGPLTYLNDAPHQKVKLVRIRPGATLFKEPKPGSEVHYQVGESETLEAELIAGMYAGGFWEGRRRGARGRFFFRDDAIEKITGVLASPEEVKAAIEKATRGVMTPEQVAALLEGVQEQIDDAIDAAKAELG